MTPQAHMPDHTPRKTGAVVICSDRGWALQSAFALQRAIDADVSGAVDYYFCCDFDVAASEFAPAFDARVQIINLGTALADLNFTATNHVPKHTFLRFFALDHLAAQYRRVCYLDGDIFLIWGSWADLFTLPETPFAVSAVASRSVWYTKPRARYGRRYRAALCPQMGDRYFNAGVLLIDCAKYRTENISARALRFYADNPSLCVQSDQSALNAVLAGQWGELSPSWNWQTSANTYALLQDFCPRAVHFTGEMKPWNDRYGLFAPALRPMADFAAAKGFADIAAQFGAVLGANPYSTPRRAARIDQWTSQKDHKLGLMHRYLQRDDFIDTAAGHAAFGTAPSGFGHPPPNPAPKQTAALQIVPV